MNIYEKLSTIQLTLKAPKGQRNTFGNYNYRSCEDILEAVKPIVAKVRATLIISDTLENIGERYYVKANAKLIDLDKPTDFIEVSSYAREEEVKKGMDGSQISGASSSYARKYALNGLFNIDDTKDSDFTNKGDSVPSSVSKSSDRKATTYDLELFNELLSEFSVERQNKLIAWVNSKFHKEPSELTNNEMNLVLITMQDKINKGDK